ncbi:MAG: prolyl oligopeptidase family serine peptidase, partial [Lentisphaeraceae bacterium]|nr:prolyl oligopeptidase family serine peptidase [Lentisphaeraceae bacterium]
MNSYLLLFTICISLISSADDKAGPWNLTKLYKVPKWEKTEKASKPGMTGILYSSLPLKGAKVQVFAYYSAPKGKTPEGGWPAVVCVHGGGGTAFEAWIKQWNDHGYAAISMDLEGHYPIGSHKTGRTPTPHPGPVRVGVFHDFDKPIAEQWYYHAVAQIILAHSLIRSFPEVNADKTGITGVSWGGNLTSTTIGVDNRFKFAIPAYGCGFLPGSEGHQGRIIKEGKHWDTVAKYYDGSAYFKNVKIPTLWVNGTNDYHFSMPATQKSSQAVSGNSTLRFQVRMKHGHGPVWKTQECYAFADSIIKKTAPLLKVSRPLIKGSNIISEASDKVSSAELVYTVDKDKNWPEREWNKVQADISGNQVKAALPKDAIAAFFNLKDNKGLMISSEFIEIDQSK